MLLIAQVAGHLGLQRTFYHPLGQLLQDTVFPKQVIGFLVTGKQGVYQFIGNFVLFGHSCSSSKRDNMISRLHKIYYTLDYGGAIQNRIDDFMLVKAVRKDAVHMCGLIMSSDSAFFEKLSPKDTQRFFEESKTFLTEFVGAENVISAMVHMDEKTPHMHFLHVPVTSNRRLSAKIIYTRENLKKLQTELPKHLQNCGFTLQRGVEQEPGAANTVWKRRSGL